MSINFELDKVAGDMEVIQSRLSDLSESHYFFKEDYFNKRPATREEYLFFGRAFNEMRIQVEQQNYLLHGYAKELKEAISKLNELIQNQEQEIDYSIVNRSKRGLGDE